MKAKFTFATERGFRSRVGFPLLPHSASLLPSETGLKFAVNSQMKSLELDQRFAE